MQARELEVIYFSLNLHSTKNKDNLSPVATKQSGCFAFGRKPKAQQKTSPEQPTPTAAIPTIDNIYNHIMKPTPDTEPSTREDSYAATSAPAPAPGPATQPEDATQLFSY